ncbi:hypothetical protein H257_17718 [Aphanomyces astaci]|uniref:Peptidase S1 domain-containing protein n=1 Tax=Aphanomyces astaci TaxID=112090 RepID=W4FFG6_APHAT|nr:hypothetical protein H257_17718 [Aphanomyces astaci]ETV65609.1 hypothetical protein H257_17718 [Aphanomyces astaci]RQM27245.1 hypothetical protein B5M09_012829 [Aphanomyces astaci]|eukprot:XP_009844906.1 hypothetical protein H257_17718 [Aphanomyces astaci]
MKFALLLALTVAVAAFAQDQIALPKVAWGDEAPEYGFEILGGQEAQLGKHRYVAGLKVSPNNVTVCGGSLIAPNVVLTAAHCLTGKLRSVVVGTHYLTGFADGELANVTQEIKHPDRYDVGIAILDRNITTIEPVKVSFEFFPADVLTWVRGWGFVTWDGPQSPVLKEVSVTTWNNTRASAALTSSPRPLYDTELGAGGVKGEDSCNRDSGGPLTIEENGTVRLVAVVAWGDGCGKIGKPGIYERTSAARAFIEPYLPK